MSFNVNSFSAALKFGGARPSLFQVNITNPVNSVGDIQIPFMVKAAQIPSATLSPIEVPYFGRKIKVAGPKQYIEWTVTVINDEDFLVRNGFEEWSNAINSPQENLTDLGGASPLLYKSTGQVTQFSKTGAPLRIYDMVGLWPSEVGVIELAWENGEQIEEFQVTFQFDYHTISGGITGRAGT